MTRRRARIKSTHSPSQASAQIVQRTAMSAQMVANPELWSSPNGFFFCHTKAESRPGALMKDRNPSPDSIQGTSRISSSCSRTQSNARTTWCLLRRGSRVSDRTPCVGQTEEKSTQQGGSKKSADFSTRGTLLSEGCLLTFVAQAPSCRASPCSRADCRLQSRCSLPRNDRTWVCICIGWTGANTSKPRLACKHYAMHTLPVPSPLMCTPLTAGLPLAGTHGGAGEDFHSVPSDEC